VSQLDGVYSVQQPHFWTLCSNVYVGGLKLEVSPTADTKFILSHTHNIFAAVTLFMIVSMYAIVWFGKGLVVWGMRPSI